MSEYMEIESELSDDGLELYVYTNLRLADGAPESYASLAAMEEGSPVAQALAVIEGIAELQIEGTDLVIVPHPEVAWHVIAEDVSAALKDFFL